MKTLMFGIFLVTVSGMPYAGSAVAQSDMKFDVDLSGSDYRHFDIPRPRPRLCEQACLAENKCGAWTFVRPGLLGPRASCWLKSDTPKEQRDTCCISGWK